MPDGDEQPGGRQLGGLARREAAQADGAEPSLAVGGQDLGVPEEADLVVGERPLLHDLAGAQRVAAVHQGDRPGEPGEEGGLLESTVSTADDDDVLLAEEEPVAGRAPRDPVTGELLLAGDPELAVARAHRQDDGLGEVGVVADRDGLRVDGQVDGGDVVGDERRAEPLRLAAELVHEVRSHHTVREAGEVLDIGRVHERTARGHGALERQRGQAGAGQVDRGGVPRRSGADDDGLVDRAGRAGARAGAHCTPLVGYVCSTSS